jgi:hypothetical protein
VRVVARGSGGTAAVSGGGLAPAVVAAPKDRVRLGAVGGIRHSGCRGGRGGGGSAGRLWVGPERQSRQRHNGARGEAEGGIGMTKSHWRAGRRGRQSKMKHGGRFPRSACHLIGGPHHKTKDAECSLAAFNSYAVLCSIGHIVKSLPIRVTNQKNKTLLTFSGEIDGNNVVRICLTQHYWSHYSRGEQLASPVTALACIRMLYAPFNLPEFRIYFICFGFF